MSDDVHKTITLEEVQYWAQGAFTNHLEAYMLDILHGEMSVEEARENVLSFRKEKRP